MKEQPRDITLDILKAIGFLMVFIAHFNQMFPSLNGLLHKALMYGQMGCQLFLLVVGYLFAASWESKRNGHYLAYLKKKAVSFAPGYYIALLVYWLIGLIFLQIYNGTPFAGEYTFLRIVANALFVHGLIPQCNNNIVPGGWYLGTLMVLYALLPIFMPKLGKNRSLRFLAPFIASTLALAVCVVMKAWTPEFVGNNSFFYYSFICQGPAVLLGIVLYFERDKVKDIPLFFAFTVFLIFTAITLGILAVGNDLAIAFAPLFAALSFIGLYVIVSKTQIPRIYSLLQKIGRASYGNYLFHFIFAWYVPYMTKRLINHSDNLLFLLLFFPCFALACFLGNWSTKFLSGIAFVFLDFPKRKGVPNDKKDNCSVS